MPRSAKVDIIIQVVVNNVRYTATKKEVVPQDDFAGVSIAEADIKEEQVPWPTVNLRVDVTAVPELDRTMAVRLLARAPHAEPVVYKRSVKARSGSTSFAAVAPASTRSGPSASSASGSSTPPRRSQPSRSARPAAISLATPVLVPKLQILTLWTWVSSPCL